ncbi:MAG: hypothetical protein LBU85_07245, partial [Treponema sp.]|nr:hypothetical protein [Treponema sp.]
MVLRNTGLFFLLMLLQAAAHAQEPRILIQTAPDRPVEGTALTLTLLAAHSNPDEVNVLAPPFTDGLFLDFMLKGPRMANLPDAADLSRWTAIEFRFALTGHGTVTFEPFTVITPHGQTQTYPFNIVVQRDPNANGNRTVYFRLSWENIPASLKIGETANIAL